MADSGCKGSPEQDPYSWQVHFRLWPLWLSFKFFYYLFIHSFFPARRMSPSLSSSPSETRLQLAFTSSPLCQCCHLLQFHHLFSFSLNFSPHRCEPQHSCTHWKHPGLPWWSCPSCHKNITVPEPWQKASNTLHFPTTSTAAAPSTLEGSPSPSDLTITTLNAGIPILHSTQPLDGGALSPP